MTTIHRLAPRAGFLTSLALIALLAACTAGSPTAPGGTATVSGGVVEISADDLMFDVSTIEAPAGEVFTIILANNEDQPHNVSVYTEENGEEIFQGEIFNGPGQSMSYEIPALDAGTYYFRCDVHPDMEGSLVVGP